MNATQAQPQPTEALVESYQQLLQHISHDFSAPLRAVTGYAELLGTDRIDADEQAEFLAALQGAAGRLQAMFDGLREYSRLLRYPPSLQSTSFAVLADFVRDRMFVRLNEEHADLQIHGNCDLHVDVERMMKALVALLDNALSHAGRSDGVLVSLQAEQLDDHILITVRDNGAGIAEPFRDQVFDLFWQAEVQEESSHVGMGLPYAKEVVAQHGGALYLNDAVAPGACFCLRLPLVPA